MLTIEIAYNPYWMKVTSLKIGQQDVLSEGKNYERIHDFAIKEIPLESWIDKNPSNEDWLGFLAEANKYAKEDRIRCTFSGRKLDYELLKDSFEQQAKDSNFTIEFNFNESIVDSKILENVERAYMLVQDPKFEGILQSGIAVDDSLKNAYSNLEQTYSEAMNGEFHVVFSGLYSSGKSTIINALLGKNLLPTAEKTCTARVFEIHHDLSGSKGFAKLKCLDALGNTIVEEAEYADEISFGNALKKMFFKDDNGNFCTEPTGIDTVVVSTNISRLYPDGVDPKKLHLVLIDTPGTDSGTGNQSEDCQQRHDNITADEIFKNGNSLIVFCIKATDNEKESISKFLDKIDNHCNEGYGYDQRFLFVLNHADESDTSNWNEKLGDTKKYFKGKRTITAPRFFPTCAKGAYNIRSIQDLHSVDEHLVENLTTRYYYADGAKKEGFDAQCFEKYCSTSQAISRNIENQLHALQKSTRTSEDILKEVELHSGIVSLEMTIQDYIKRYAVPIKIRDLVSAYKTIFTQTLSTVTAYGKTLERIKDEINGKSGEISAKEADKRGKAEQKEKCDDFFRELNRMSENLKKCIGHKDEKNGEIEKIRKLVSDKKNVMHDRIIDLIKEAADNPKEPSIKAKIKAEIDSTQDKCLEELNAQNNSTWGKVKEIEKDINQLFQENRDLDIGEGIKLGDIVSFNKCVTDSIMKINNAHHEVEKQGGFFYETGKKLKKAFARLFGHKYDPTMIEVDDGIDTGKLRKATADLLDDFDKGIEKAQENAEKTLNDLKDSLTEKLDSLKDKIKELQKELERKKKELAELVKEKGNLESEEADCRENKEYLDTIHKCIKMVTLEK